MNKEYKRVREEIAEWLFYRDWDKNFTTMRFLNGDWTDDFDNGNTEYIRERYRKEAEQILSIEGLCILSDDQSLPELYPEEFARGLILPPPNTLDDYIKFGKWLQEIANFKKVI